jgi:hypothetical protein
MNEDKLVIYHSDEWELLVTPQYLGSFFGWHSWITWSVDENIATMKWSKL